MCLLESFYYPVEYEIYYLELYNPYLNVHKQLLRLSLGAFSHLQVFIYSGIFIYDLGSVDVFRNPITNVGAPS